MSSVKHLILPSITLGAAVAAIVARVLRSSMVETLRQDYVTLARAKGQVEFLVVMKHALRNALIPTVTVVGLQVGVLLGGNMIVETVFGWPGLGRLVVNAIFQRDFPAGAGCRHGLCVYLCDRQPGRGHPVHLPESQDHAVAPG